MLYLTVVDSGANVTDRNVKVTDENDKMMIERQNKRKTSQN